MRVIYEENRPMSILEIASKARMSWVTARDRLKSLKEKGFVLELSAGIRSKWELNYDKIDEILR
jgi:DNA-binding Lrp family transcriptional regulator